VVPSGGCAPAARKIGLALAASLLVLPGLLLPVSREPEAFLVHAGEEVALRPRAPAPVAR
jgi:hypothetical protein